MKRVVVDVETSVFQKGNPFSRKNELIVVGLKTNEGYYLGLEQETILGKTEGVLLIGFNIKFDLHWLRRYSLLPSVFSVWDCQLAHFILRGQSCPYPSLNDVSCWYQLGSKLDIVALS